MTTEIQFDWRNLQFDNGHFTDKLMLVTGAASGIGRAVTLALAEQGATVLMLDKKARHLEKLFDLIMESHMTEPVILPVDLIELTPESVTTLAQAVYDNFGHLDGLLHNAAELGSLSPLDQYDMDDWKKVMQVNLLAPYLLTRAMLPLLKRDYPSNIIFSSADVGRTPQAYWGAYSIAYSGVEAQMTIWAEELQAISNIRINSVDPGPIRTGLRRRSHPGENQDTLLPPQTIATAYLYLMDEQHAFHGQKIKLQ